MEKSIKETAAVFKALGDENRLRILRSLASGEKCACKLLEEMQITQPTLSHHMKILCEAGLVTGRKEGKWMHYSISGEGVVSVRQYLDLLTGCKMISEEKPCCET